MKKFALPVLLIILVMVGFMGCASSPNRQQSTIQASEYRKIMDRQKAEIAAEEKAAQKIPELNAEGYEKLGDRYLSQENVDRAFINYHKALEKDSSQLRVRYKMGHLFLEKGLKEEAQREFQEILKADPQHALAYEGLGRVSFQAADYPEAEKNFQKAIQLNPSVWQAYNFLGILYDRQGKFEAAITQYKAAISLQPKMGILFNNLGLSFALNGEKEKALAAYTEAIKLETSNPKVYNNLAMVLGQMERYPEALEAFKKGGDEATAYYNLGCLFLSKGKPNEAIGAFEKAIEIKPGFYVQAHQKMKKAREALHTPAAPYSPAPAPRS
jgi:Flp pilus assembly protein TadD